MDKKVVWKLHDQGMAPHRIAAKLGGTRIEVENIIQQRPTSRRSFLWVGVLGSLVLVALALATKSSGKVGAVSTKEGQPVPYPIIAAALDYTSRQPPDEWYIKSEAVDYRNHDRVAGLTLAVANRIEAALKRHQKIPSVKVLSEKFSGRLGPSLYTSNQGGSSVLVSVRKKDGSFDELPSNTGNLEVVLYAEGHRYAPDIKDNLLFFKDEWGAVFVGAIRMTDQWFDAVLAHELTHARLFREGAASATARIGSDSWIEEEVLAHEVERAVLDESVHGRYSRVLAEAVSGTYESLEDLYARLAPDTIAKLDSVFERGSTREVSVRSMQYLVDLGEAWLAGRYTGDELRRERIRNFRVVARL